VTKEEHPTTRPGSSTTDERIVLHNELQTKNQSKNPSKNSTKHAAGDFTQWLQGTHLTQVEGADANVPCGDCNGCCKSFYFIHITPSDTPALAAIPQELLFAAPGLPEGHFVMGYNDQGHCPMLIDDRCSIYFDRPQTCRAYDCRIFSAADMPPGETDKALVAERTQQWEFSFASDTGREQQSAVAAAARWLQQDRSTSQINLPDGFIPSNTTQLAVLALHVYPLFLTSANSDTNSQAFADRLVALAGNS